MKLLLSINLLYLSLIASPTELSRELIMQHEGYSESAYTDIDNSIVIGYGTNLSYITKDEALYLLNNRLRIADTQLSILYPWYSSLPYVPKSIVLDMTYNMGIDKFSTFKKMHYQLKHHNWTKAASEMKASLWFTQTKSRSAYLYSLMRNYSD